MGKWKNALGAGRAALLLSAVLAAGDPAAAHAGSVHEIDQIMDMTALTPEDFYRFEPNYLWVDPGDTVRFMNTTGNHTVKSVDGIWPEGVAPVDIANSAEMDVTLDTPGVYGFRCKIHSRHGMFALVIVGAPDGNIDQVSLDRVNDRGKVVFGELLERLKADRAARGTSQ